MENEILDTAFLYANRHFVQVIICLLMTLFTFNSLFAQGWKPFVDFNVGQNWMSNGSSFNKTQNGILKINMVDDGDNDGSAPEGYNRTGRFARLTFHPLPLLGLGIVGGQESYKIGYHDDSYLTSHGQQYNVNQNDGWRPGIVMSQKNYYAYGPTFRIECADAEHGSVGLYYGCIQHSRIGDATYTFNKADEGNVELQGLTSQFKKHFISNAIGFDCIFGTKKFFGGFVIQYEWSKKMMQADYTFYKDNAAQYTDHISNGMDMLSLVLVGGLSLDQVRRVHKFDHVKNPMHVFAKGDIADEKPWDDSMDTHLSIRTRDTAGLAKTGTIKRVQQTLQLYDTALNIGLWDYDRVDDDTVTVLLNGKIIAENVALGSKIQKFHVRMPRGENTLVVLFISQGKMKPCTCELLIYPRKKRVPQKFLLNSGKHNAVAIRIKNERKNK